LQSLLDLPLSRSADPHFSSAIFHFEEKPGVFLLSAAKAATKYPRLVEAARFQRSAVSIQLQRYLYILGKILNREDHKDL
jgi:hypothetical protein